jgi:hypothetical protein
MDALRKDGAPGSPLASCGECSDEALCAVTFEVQGEEFETALCPAHLEMLVRPARPVEPRDEPRTRSTVIYHQ